MALEITDASYGIFRLVDATGRNLVMRSFVGTLQAQPATEALPITSHSVMGSVALKREPVIVSDLREEPWRSIYYPFDYAIEMRSELAVPLIGAGGRLEGVLNLESPEVDAFDREDRYILQILATQAVVAIEGIRLVDALQRVSAMLATRSLCEVHQALVEQACDLLNLPMGLVWMREKDHAVVQAASEPSLCGARIPIGVDPVSQCIQSGEPVLQLETAIPFPAERPAPGSALRPGSALITPLFGGGDEPHAVGALAVYTAPGETREFAEADWDRKVISILAHYASLAIRNAAHQEALKFAEDQRATTDTFAAIGEISANLLHRLNNKVGTIPVRVEGIQDKCAALLESEVYLAENLAAIQRSASEAMQIVRESVDYLRPIQLAPVSVSAAVREALAAVKLPETVRVECLGLETLPAVQAGANRLNLVFANLLENASQAMGGRGEIRISGMQRGRWVEVRISDSGPGIPPDEQERIFEFNYSSRASSNPANLGFGLWWVKTFMTRFGGKVAVEPNANPTGRGPRGATFVLSLPVAEPI
jgi:signal transduction histidine kinase/putative methionine-R-sulfoxide reductase with GAF domain